ncbi:MAG: efflux RND transporter periplasmic adaptor subunit [Thioalkalispiraceae bacterium]|jgi:RND family efflux transporter MFP subunit
MSLKLIQIAAVIFISLGLVKYGIANDQAEQGLAVIPVKQMELPDLRDVDATFEAVQQATVSAQTSGRITEITVDVDDYVTKGDVIVRLRDKSQRAAYNAAKARYEEAQAEYKRVKDIFGKKLVAKAALDKAEAQLKTTKAQLDNAAEALENTVIRAPYSGIVVKRHVEVGETARPGQPLMTGLSLEKLRAVVQLPQTLVHYARENNQTWVWVGRNLSKRIKAESLTISPFADKDSHTFLVRVNLPGGDYQVYPGMHTKVEFQTGTHTSLVIPEKSIARRSEVTGVYVKEKDKILFRYIRLGKKLPDQQREVLSGLSAGEQILLDPDKAVAFLKSANTPTTGE